MFRGPITGALIDLYANDPTSRRQLMRVLASGNFKTLVAASAARRKPKPNRKRSRIASDRHEAKVEVLERGHPHSPSWPAPPVLLAWLPYRRRLGTQNSTIESRDLALWT